MLDPTMCGCGSKHKSQVLESRNRRLGEAATIKRRRKCASCGRTWSTAEISWDLFKELMEE